MLFATCLLPLVLAQAAEPTKAADAQAEIPKPYANLETMSRMFRKKIDEKREELLGSNDPAVRRAARGAANDSVTGDMIRSTWTIAPVVNSHSDYVPGLAAIFSLNVVVNTEWAEEEKESETETPKAPSHTDDDAAWESVANPPAGTMASQGLYLWRTSRGGMDGKAQARKRRLAPAAVETLKKTVLDTIWRFGHKLELERGERLAVVVEVQGTGQPAGGNYVDMWPQGGGAGGGASPADPNGPTGGAVGGEGPGSGNLPTLNNFGRMTVLGDYFAGSPTPGLRLVIQVAAEDLKAYRAGELEREELAKKTRVRTFAIAGSNSMQEYGLSPAK